MHTLARLFVEPQLALELPPAEWNRILGQARHARVVAKLEAAIRDEGVLPAIPQVAQEVLTGARVHVDYLQQRLRFELTQLDFISRQLPAPFVLLKGAAYIAANSPAGAGRSVRDIDVLVHSEHLADTEAALKDFGWHFKEDLTDYDEYYYRELSHELPPLRHPEHHYELDVHHSLIEPTHLWKPDIELMLAQTVPLSGRHQLTLSTYDQFIHMATHLAASDKPESGVRDLMDGYALLFADKPTPDTISELIERAKTVGLEAPTIDTLHLLAGLLESTEAGHSLADVLQTVRVRGSGPLIRWASRKIIVEIDDSSGLMKSAAEWLVWGKVQLFRMRPSQMFKHAWAKFKR
ncbi:MAG: hypothetical protein Cons2KO_30410 [Congregibacter sp.]